MLVVALNQVDSVIDPEIISNLRQRLLVRARSEATLLTSIEPPDPERCAELIAWCHRLGGTSGTLGLTDLSEVALEMEEDLRREKPGFWRDLRRRLLDELGAD